MNTVQKARAWLIRPIEDGSEYFEIYDAYKIITALLAERQALLGALGYYMSQFGQALEAHGIPYGEHQKLADEKARQAIAMCEEQNNE